ncbi:hypothetical protein JHK86_035060 [Glycine max]|nr:hypothetical protein JHK86_035060 [Glycine max]
MSRKENLISELHMRKGTWKIVVRITDLWEVRKQNSKQAIEMVLMDQTVFQGTKSGATLWQELFAKFRHKLHCDSSTTSVKEIQRIEIPPNVYMSTLFADIISWVAPRHTLMGGSQSQSSQSNLVEKFLHNAQVVSIGEINSLKQDCYCLTFGTIDEIIIDAPWSYDNCPYCTTTFDPSKVGSACRSCQNQVNNTVPR